LQTIKEYIMPSYKELLAQRENLERQIEEAKSREYAEVLNEIKQKMADYGITLAELAGGRGGKGVKSARPRAGVAPKYRDPDSGSTWSGRGKPPKWIAGQEREGFLIQK
jgi:DNA-binding protein H-NS